MITRNQMESSYTTGLTTGSISKDLKVYGKIGAEKQESIAFHFLAILIIVLSALSAALFAADFCLAWGISGWVCALVISFLFGIVITGSVTLMRIIRIASRHRDEVSASSKY